MTSLSKVKLEALEGAVSGAVNNLAIDSATVELSEDAKMELDIMNFLFKSSPTIEGCLQGLTQLIGRDDDGFSVRDKIEIIASQWFRIGWHCRGSVDQVEELKRLVSGEAGPSSQS